jgi:hypothetical protein
MNHCLKNCMDPWGGTDTLVTPKRADELQPGDHIIDVLFDIPRIARVITLAVFEGEAHLTVRGLPCDAPKLTVDADTKFHVVTVR